MRKPCDAIGCAEPARAKGLCTTHYALNRGGTLFPRRQTATLEADLSAMLAEAPPGESTPAHELLRRQLSDPDWAAKAPPEQVQALARGAAELRAQAESEVRRQKLIPPREVVKMLASVHETWVHEAGARAPGLWTASILDQVNQLVGRDLRQEYPSIDSLITQVLVKGVNETLARVFETVEKETRAVEMRVQK